MGLVSHSQAASSTPISSEPVATTVITNDDLLINQTNLGSGTWTTRRATVAKVLTSTAGVQGAVASALVIDPRAYGAKCDLSTDDSLAFSNAFYVASGNGGELRIPYPGLVTTWIFTNTANSGTGNARLIGATPQTTLQFNAAGGSGTFLTFIHGMDIENLTISGPGQNVGNWWAVEYTNTTDKCLLKNVTFQNWSGVPLWVDDTSYCNFQDLYFKNCHYGIRNGGYSDDQDWRFNGWSTTNLFDTGFPSGLGGNNRMNAGHLKVGSEHAEETVIIGNSTYGMDIQQYAENYTNAVLDIGHDPAEYGTMDSTNGISPGCILFHHSYCQGSLNPLQDVRLWIANQGLTVDGVRSEQTATGHPVVHIMNSAAKGSPIWIRNVNADNSQLLKDDLGNTVIGFPYDELKFNVEERYFAPGLGLTTNELLRIMDHATGVPLTLSGTAGQFPVAISNDNHGLCIAGGITRLWQAGSVMPALVITNRQNPTTNTFEIRNYDGGLQFSLAGDWNTANETMTMGQYWKFLTDSTGQQLLINGAPGAKFFIVNTNSSGTGNSSLAVVQQRSPPSTGYMFELMNSSFVNQWGVDNNYQAHGGGTYLTNNASNSASDVLMDASYTLLKLSGAHKATLPDCTTNAGREFTIKCITAGTNGIYTIGNQTIDGVNGTTGAGWTNLAAYSSVTVWSDGTQWWVKNTFR